MGPIPPKGVGSPLLCCLEAKCDFYGSMSAEASLHGIRRAGIGEKRLLPAGNFYGGTKKKFESIVPLGTMLGLRRPCIT